MKQIILTLIISSTSLFVQAQQDTTKVVQDPYGLSLEELMNITIVTASKTQQQAGMAPATVMVITEEQIRLRGYRSLLEVIQDMPDFKVDNNTSGRSRNRFAVRGVEGEQQKFVIMLDGVRISAPTNENIPIMENYPVNLAKQIEIIYGPASALYGADAICGIINIISKKASGKDIQAEAAYLAGDSRLVNATLFTSKKISEDITLTVSGQYFYDGGVDMSKENAEDLHWAITSHQTGTFNTVYGLNIPEEQVDASYSSPLKAYNLYAGLKAGNFDIAVFKNYSQNSSSLEYNLSNAVHNKDVFYGRGVGVFSARHTAAINNKVSLFSSISGSQFRINPESSLRNVHTNMERAFKYGHSSVLRVEEQLAWNISERSNVIGGVLYESFFALPESPNLENKVTDHQSIEGVLSGTVSTYLPDGIPAKFYAIKYYNTGAYMQLQQKVAEELNLTLGARYDYNSRFGSTFNPRLGVVWNVTESTVLKAMAGTAFVAPNPTDTYSYSGDFSTLDSGRTYYSEFFRLPNPGLKPTTSRNIEVSARQFVNKTFSVTVAGYYTQLKNLLDMVVDEGNTNLYQGRFLGWPVDRIEVFSNVSHQNVWGASLQLDYNRNIRNGYLKAYSYFSFVDGREESVLTDDNGGKEFLDVQLHDISRWMVKAGADIAVKKWSFSPRLIWLDKQHINGFVNPDRPDERQSIPGYSLLNISLSYKLNVVTFFANVTNALNQKYRSVGPKMDLQETNTTTFYGKAQDPLRVAAGIRMNF